MPIHQIKKNQAIWKLIFQTATDCIFVKDLRGRYIEANEATARLFGLECEQLIGATDDELFGDDATQKIREQDRQVLCGTTIQEEATKPVAGKPRTLDELEYQLYCEQGHSFGL